MTELLIMIRNLVLAAILGWLGLEFAPGSPEEDKPSEKLAALAILG